MRVLMISHRFPPDAVAGVERYTESLADELQAGGDAVTVLTRRPGPGPVRPVREQGTAGVDVIRLVGGGVDRERWLHLARSMEDSFSTILEELQPDVVHVNHLVDLSPRFLALARAAGAAVVLTLHDFWFPCPRITLQRPDGSLCDGPQGGAACAAHCYGPEPGIVDGDVGPTDRLRLRALYFRRLLDVPDRVLCPSRYVADWFEGWGLEAGRVRPLPNGIRLPAPAEERDEAARPRGRLQLAILGAVVRHKGHNVVIEALAGDGVDADLYVHGPLGDAGFASELRALAADVPGLRLHICGAYEPADLSLLLEGIDLVIVPSVWPETFCLVVREGLARGVPAITTRLGALPAAIEHGVNGFLYDHDQPAQLGDLLRRSAREPGLLERLARGAVSTRIPTLEEHADGVRAEYAAALGEREANAVGAEAAIHELEALERLLGDSPGEVPSTQTLEGVA
ncbi:MAG: glycosyltransferase [Gemmatimonadota bacterium]|nr:glycosyltransferase [Gemmatimonadota bacterium]